MRIKLKVVFILILIIVFKFDSFKCLKHWLSNKIPDRDGNCLCNKWVYLSSDIKWKTHEFKEKNRFNSAKSCRYAIQLNRTKCVSTKLQASGQNVDVKKHCKKGHVRINRSFYLPRNRCHAGFQNFQITENCDKCEDEYKRTFSLCYSRLSENKKNRVHYCKVNWTNCETSQCNSKPHFWWSLVKLSDDCGAKCTDGLSIGMITSVRKCVALQNNSDIASGVSCLPGEVGKERKFKCPLLPNCNDAIPTNEIKFHVATSDALPTSTGIPNQENDDCNLSTTSSNKNIEKNQTNTNMGITMIFTSTFNNIISDEVTFTAPEEDTNPETEVILVTSSSWSSFVVAMTIIGIILLLVVICLASAVCYIVFCQNKKNVTNIYEVVRRSRNSLERGYERFSAFIRGQNQCIDSTKPGPSQTVPMEAVTPITLHMNDKVVVDNDEDAEYWTICDVNGEGVTSFLRDDAINHNIPLEMRKTTAQYDPPKIISKLSGSLSHGGISNKAKNPLVPPTGDSMRSSSEKELKKRVSCPGYDWKTKARLSAFLDDEPSHSKSCDGDKQSFDDIINEISTLRRDLSFITSRTKSEFLPKEESALHTMYADRSSSSDESVNLYTSVSLANSQQEPIPMYSPRLSITESPFKKILPPKSPIVPSQVCNVTSLTQKSPAISVLHPRERRFGLIRGREDHNLGKIVIDTTKAKPEHINTEARIARPHHSSFDPYYK
ncbi:uncharacterized protein LOC120340409 [Styela clava]